MDGSARAAGVGAPITLAKRDFSVKGRTQGFQGAIEAEILKLRGNPLSLIVDAAKSIKGDRALLDQVAGVISERFRNWGMATHADYAEFCGTPRGQALAVWWAIKHNDNPPSIEQIEFWLGEMAGECEMQKIKEPKPDGPTEELVNIGWKKIADILNAIDFASGEDALGNSIGP